MAPPASPSKIAPSASATPTYIKKILVNTKVAQNWYTQEADPRASNGKSVTLVFDINRDGTPSNARVETRSGSSSLDLSAMRAVQRVEGFGPLPQGGHITVEYTFHFSSFSNAKTTCPEYLFDYRT